MAKKILVGANQNHWRQTLDATAAFGFETESSVKPSALCGVEGVAQKKTDWECAWLGVIYFSKNSIFMVKVWTEVLAKTWKISFWLLSTSAERACQKKKCRKHMSAVFWTSEKIGLLRWCSPLVKTQLFQPLFYFSREYKFAAARRI